MGVDARATSRLSGFPLPVFRNRTSRKAQPAHFARLIRAAQEQSRATGVHGVGMATDKD
jgi:hypothetical protein